MLHHIQQLLDFPQRVLADGEQVVNALQVEMVRLVQGRQQVGQTQKGISCRLVPEGILRLGALRRGVLE